MSQRMLRAPIRRGDGEEDWSLLGRGSEEEPQRPGAEAEFLPNCSLGLSPVSQPQRN